MAGYWLVELLADNVNADEPVSNETILLLLLVPIVKNP